MSKNTALTGLICWDNKLTALDLSKNTALTDLRCYNNQLTALDISENTALTRLFCYNNQLTALDVSKNTALTYLDCSDQTRSDYIFNGWYKDEAYSVKWDGNKPYSIALYAKWTPISAGYAVGFAQGKNTSASNGVTASGVLSGTSFAAGAEVTVAVTLSGAAAKAGTQNVRIKSAVANVTFAPTHTDVAVTAGQASFAATYTFKFTMPRADVTDIEVENTWIDPDAGKYAVSFAVAKDAATANGVTAAGSVTGKYPENETVEITVTLSGTAAKAGTHTVRIVSGADDIEFDPVDETVEVGAGQASFGGPLRFTFDMPADSAASPTP